MYCTTPQFLIQCFIQLRKVSTKVRVSVALDDRVSSDVNNKLIKPRKHPGIRKLLPSVLPPDIHAAIKRTLDTRGTPTRQLLNEGQALNNYIHSRLPPNEEESIEEKKQMLLEKVERKIGFDKTLANEEERVHYEKVVTGRVNALMIKQVYFWKPINFDCHMSLKYAVIRGPAEYAVLCRVFTEIKNLTNNYPRTLFDFGSGIGTARWAAESIWGNSINEFYCVDPSSDMNDVSESILEKAGRKSTVSFYRQFLPASHQKTFDVVVSAFSLFELPSVTSRLQTIANLWNKTGRYLVLVETGSLAAFRILSEARDFILGMCNYDPSLVGHVAAPCPHDGVCPRNDGTPCNFEVSYQAFNAKQPGSKELFCYVILEKGQRDLTKEPWPRIVRPVLPRSGHVVCKLCTHRGKLEQVTISRTKPDRETYKCAKASNWGDLLPVQVYDKKIILDEDDAGSE